MARTVISLASLQDTEYLAKELALKLKPGDVLAFFGDLGSGKTTLIKYIVSFLDYPKTQVTSPTFNYLNIYDAKLPLYHFDLYRFEGDKDFLQKGFDEYFDLEGVCLIEWAEKIPSLLPEKTIKIHLSYSQGERICQVD